MKSNVGKSRHQIEKGKNMNIDYENLAERVQMIRLKAKDTQQSLADKLYTTRQSISEIENCYKLGHVNMDLVVDIAQHYGVSVDYLIGSTNLYYNPNETIDKLHLSQSASMILKNQYVDTKTVSLLLENEKFRDLINRTSAYLEDLTYQTYNGYQQMMEMADDSITELKEEKGISVQKFDRDQSFIKAQINDFDPAMLNRFSTDFAEVIKELKDVYGIDEEMRNSISVQDTKIAEVSSNVVNNLKGKPFTPELVASLLVSGMKEQRVFGKNLKAYELLKELYIIVFKEQRLEELKGK